MSAKSKQQKVTIKIVAKASENIFSIKKCFRGFLDHVILRKFFPVPYIFCNRFSGRVYINLLRG